MKQTTIRILYWVFTILFAGLMIFSSVSGLTVTDEAKGFYHDMLGYPVYMIPFLSWAKVIGCISILLPGLNKTIKEWAYAGLFFDLAGATYSGLGAGNFVFDPRILGMLIWIVPGILSYIFWKKK